MQPESKEYLNGKNIDHLDFIPQLITSNLLKRHDLIITMECSHKDDIIYSYSTIKNISEKTYTLKEFNGAKEDLDIIDPYYTNRNTYQKIMKLIDIQVEKLILKIMKINQNGS